MRKIIEIIRSYMEGREPYRTALRTPVNIQAFSALVDDHAERLGKALASPFDPYTSPEEWEALAELCMARGTQVRNAQRRDN